MMINKSLKKFDILYIEPDLIYQTMFKKLFIKNINSLDIASNGENAIGFLSNKKNYDMIIFNLFMPMMDGINFLNYLIEIDYQPNRLIMLYSDETGDFAEINKDQLKPIIKKSGWKIETVSKTKFRVEDVCNALVKG